MAGKLTWLLTHHFTWFPSLPSHLIASHPSSPFGRASSLEVAILPWRFLGGFLTCWTRRTRRAGRAPYLADFPFRICWQPGNLNHYLVSWHMTSVFRHLVLKTSPFLLASDLVPSWSLGHCWIPSLSVGSALKVTRVWWTMAFERVSSDWDGQWWGLYSSSRPVICWQLGSMSSGGWDHGNIIKLIRCIDGWNGFDGKLNLLGIAWRVNWVCGVRLSHPASKRR